MRLQPRHLCPMIAALSLVVLSACGGGAGTSGSTASASDAGALDTNAAGSSQRSASSRASSSKPAASSSSMAASSSSKAASSTASSVSSAAASSTTVSACAAPAGRVLEVGIGKTYGTPSQAAAAAQAGDTIRIAAGNYSGDVATWTKENLTICGVGGQAHLYAAGNNAGGKGIWVAAGNNMVVENISFHDATVPDQNGAGIRVEPNVSLTLRNCGFYDNQNGILGGSGSGNIVIEGSEFARNGRGDGYTHGIYIGNANSLVVRQSFFHETKIGHNLKSRAKQSTVENSYFMDGTSGTASYQLDFPNGGQVLLRGNLVQKGPNADNPIGISYGAEGFTWSGNTLALTHNTVVMTHSGGSFLYANASTQSLKLTANLFAGTSSPGLLSGLSTGSAVVQQSANYITQASLIPGADNVANPRFWPDASLLPALTLTTVPDAQYLQDSPAPRTARAISGSNRVIGALQSTP